MNTRQLEKTFSESEIILCRSGYTTIMDLAKLGKKAFFIPTPGQFEQVYLAEKMQLEGLLPSANQDDFRIENLSVIDDYKGFPQIETKLDWAELFEVFEK